MSVRFNLRIASSLVLASLLLSTIPFVATALPTPGLFCEEARTATGRLFPEAMQTNDYVGFDEALCGFAVLEREHPERIEVIEVAQSVGWQNAVTGQHDQFPVLVVEVTNEESVVAFEDKQKLVFQLSIHGNEKGGREGGFRIIEDLVRGIGYAQTHPELLERLDYQVFVFIFINPDGWRHEEPAYRRNCANYVSEQVPVVGCVESQNFVRTNGNGKDMNRNWPVAGWVHEPHTPMSEPEVVGTISYLRNLTNIALASDIHGMLYPANWNPQAVFGGSGPLPVDPEPDWRGHFVLTMLPAGRQSPAAMAETTSLAETVKQYLNGNPFFAEWQNLPSIGGAWGGEFNEWGTVWDTIGYTDSGFTSDFFAQMHGLGVPGVSFELAYNHITFDNYYPGVAQRMNAYHVESVRDIVRAFSDHAAMKHSVALETNGARTGYLFSAAEASSRDAVANVSATDWAATNEADDVFEARAWSAKPNDYFLDLVRAVRSGGAPGVLEAVNVRDLDAARLARFDNFVVSGSAWAALADDAAKRAALKAWVESGGNLVVTDEALKFLEELGVASAGGVQVYETYAGATNFVVSRDHELVKDIRGLARQTYEPVPVGFSVRGGGSAPVWFVDAASYMGEVVGVAGGNPDYAKVNLGQATVGEGRVVFLGALLPTPSRDHYHPYGLESYATTYTGNQILFNALGWTQLAAQEPRSVEDFLAPSGGGFTAPAGEDVRGIPAAGVFGVLAALGAVALVARRRRA